MQRIACCCRDANAYHAGDHVPQVMRYGPIGLEGFDRRLNEDERKKGGFDAGIALLPPGGGWLLAEFGGQSKAEVESKARPLIDELKKQQNAPAITFFDDPTRQGKIWTAREGGVGASSAVPGEHFTWPSWEDAAVPPEKLGDYLRDFQKVLDKYGYETAFFGHFGQGCLHTRISFDLRTAEGVQDYRRFIDDAADLVLSYGGSLSGEHGEGQVYSEWLPTRPSSFRTTTRAGCGRPAPMPWA